MRISFALGNTEMLQESPDLILALLDFATELLGQTSKRGSLTLTFLDLLYKCDRFKSLAHVYEVL